MPFLRSVYAILIDFIETIVVALCIFFIIYFFLFRPFQVNGESMLPNYNDKEYILTSIIGKHIGAIKRGQVVVFEAPVDENKDFIKRVIGVAGDHVMIKDGQVYLNGSKLDESSYLPPDFKTFAGSFLAEGQEVTVPDDSFFVLGDNRGKSSDSREWGFVTKKEIVGKSLFVYWPINKMRFVKSGKYPN